jgi:hypothetical protein
VGFNGKQRVADQWPVGQSGQHVARAVGDRSPRRSERAPDGARSGREVWFEPGPGAGAGAGVQQTTDLLINATTSSAGRHARSHRDLDPAQYTQGPERQPVGRDGRDADRAGACAHRVDRQGTFRICRTKRFGRSTWLPLCFDRTLKCSLSRLKNSQFLPNRSNLLADIMQFIMGLFT